ncbi:MAG: ROK family protein [Solirubrobacterales bacterium]
MSVETIGVDLGGTKMLVGALAGTETRWESREASTGQSQEELVELLVREVGKAKAARPDVAAVGLGIPARIDRRRGLAIGAVNLPIAELPIRDLVAERVDLPVYVDNDANVAAYAEFLYGAGREATDMVMLTIGTGIGGGLILDGEIYRGGSGGGAELGHMVIDINGPPCQGSCPGRGHIESFASGTALGREGMAAAESDPDSALATILAAEGTVDGKAVTEAAQAGDPTAKEIFELVGSRLGVALTSLANIFDPQMFVFGGGVMAAGELLLAPARRELRERALTPMNEAEVVPAELGADAGMIGAAAMARTELEREAN